MIRCKAWLDAVGVILGDHGQKYVAHRPQRVQISRPGDHKAQDPLGDDGFKASRLSPKSKSPPVLGWKVLLVTQ